MRLFWLLLVPAVLPAQTGDDLLGTWEETYIQVGERHVSYERAKTRVFLHFGEDGLGWQCFAERPKAPEAGLCYDFEWEAERQFSAAGEAIDGQISMSGSWWLRLCIGEGQRRPGRPDASNTLKGWCTAVTTLTATSLVAQNGWQIRQGMKRLRE
jgi:hypothetical protein